MTSTTASRLTAPLLEPGLSVATYDEALMTLMLVMTLIKVVMINDHTDDSFDGDDVVQLMMLMLMIIIFHKCKRNGDDVEEVRFTK